MFLARGQKKNLLMYVPTYRECCARYSAYMILLFHTIFHPVINYLVHFFAFHLQAKKNHVSPSTSNSLSAKVYRLEQ